jgi:cytoskeletal protein CcmA (bactofilin family)
VNVFGKKDSIKEFEQMRQALKPAERFAVRTDNSDAASPSATEGSNPSVAAPAGPVSAPAPGKPMASSPESCSSVVSLGSALHGNLKSDGSVRIEGQVTGEVDAKDTVHVLDTAKVDAKVRAAFVVIAGDLEGEVHCSERLEILPSGRVKAHLTTKSLMICEGAFIEGQIQMSNGPHMEILPAGGSARNRDGASKPIAEKAPTAAGGDRPAAN